MLFGRGNRDQTCQTCWKQLPYGYKFLFLFTLGYNALSLFLSFLISQVYFDAYLVVHEFQIWRLIVPFLPAGVFPMSMINILINFLWLLSIFPPLQKRLSTAWTIIEVIIQNFLINFVLSLVGIIMYWLFGMAYNDFILFNYGLFPMTMIFIWQQASLNPDQHTNFCCMPCMIPMKWIPVIMLAFSLLFASPLLPALIAASILGYYQFMHIKRRFIKLPLRFYRKIDLLMPQSVRNRPDYVKVSQVQNDLKFECSDSIVSVGASNPFNRNNRNQNQNQNQNEPAQQQSDKVQVIGKGVSIGGGQAQNFRGFWASKAQPQQHQIQIQPTPVVVNQNPFSQQQSIRTQYSQQPFHKQQIKQNVQNSHQGLDNDYFKGGNDSNIGFKMDQHDEKQSEQQLSEKDERKVAKKNLLE